ncbi:medium-chain fatty acid ethyl ester synthase/esterase 2, partial [Coemansia sp. RSA 2598]
MVPSALISSGKLQSMYSSKQARKRDKASDIRYERYPMTMSDGGLVSLDWYPKQPLSDPVASTDASVGSYTLDESKPTSIVIVMPPSMGSSSDFRIRSLAKELHANGPAGCHVVVVNHRGFGSTPLVTTRVPSFDYTGDLREVVEYLSKTYSGTPLGAVGYSMGANILTKYLGEQGKECKLSTAATICCIYDVTMMYEAISEPTLFNIHVLQPSLLSAATRFAKKHYDVIQGGARKYNLDRLLRSNDFWDIDRLLTAPNAGYSSYEQYHRGSS